MLYNNIYIISWLKHPIIILSRMLSFCCENYLFVLSMLLYEVNSKSLPFSHENKRIFQPNVRQTQ